MAKQARSKSGGYTMDLIETEEQVEHMRRKGCFGCPPQIGYYSMYLGPTDGGFLVLPPEDVEPI